MPGNISELYGEDFDTRREDAATGSFEPLPPGWYPVMVDDAEIKDTRAGTGKILKLELVVIGETFNGRRIFANINLMNPNAKAVEIGIRELAALGQACGLAAIADSDQLLGQQIMARVKITSAERSGTGEPDNNVTAYRAIDVPTAAPPAAAPDSDQANTPAPQQAAAVGAAPTAYKATPPAAPPVKAPVKSKMPWEK